MKKLYFSLLAVLLFCSISSAQINVTVLLKKPVPKNLGSLQSDPSALQVILNNTTPNPYPLCIVSLQIKNEEGTVVAKTKNTDVSMPKFNIPAAPEALILNGSQLINFNALYIDQNIKTTVMTTNSLPEGNYQICINVFDNFGNEISIGGEKCDFFDVTLSDPPSLISPIDKEVLINNYPQFFWTPVVVSPYIIGVEYRLKIVKVLLGQTTKTALETNTPLFDKYLPTNSYQYLPSDYDLDFDKSGKDCAWQVQAVNKVTHMPIDEIGHSGKSEVWSFTPPSGDPAILKLLTPTDNSLLTPISNQYKFTWDSKKQKKTISSFSLKIVEVKEGQTPAIAMLINEPVLVKEQIPYFMNSTVVNETENALYDQHNYAWQVYAHFNTWQGLIDSSNIWSFTAKNSSMKVLTIESPLNNSLLAPDPDSTKNHAFIFKWKKDNVAQTIKNFSLKIVPYIEGQTPSQALQMAPVYFKSSLPSNSLLHLITPEQGVFINGKKYVWIVEAKSNSDQVIAKSEPSTFTISGSAVIAENVKDLIVNKYIVTVKTVTNKNVDKFSGTGEVILWTGGPKFTVPFDNLKIAKSQDSTRWKVVGGSINTTVTSIYLPLIVKGANNTKLSATLLLNGIAFEPANNSMYGKVTLTTPFLSKVGTGVSQYKVESYAKFLKVDPVNRILLDTIQILYKPDDELYDPLGFKLNLSNTSNFIIKKDVSGLAVDLDLVGAITLPAKFLNSQGDKISINFKNIKSFNFNTILNTQSFFYKLTTNEDLYINPEQVNVDLYSGKVYVTKGAFKFDYHKFGMAPLNFTSTTSNIYFSSVGFNSNFQTISSGSTKYRGYTFNTKDFYLKIINGGFASNCFLNGKVIIPFIKQSADLWLYFTKDGITSGNLTNTVSFINKDLNIYSGAGGFQKLDININSIIYKPFDNKFWFNAYLTFKNSKGEGLITDPIAVSNVNIDSTGTLRIGTAFPGFWENLNVNKEGKYNGFPLTVERIKIPIFNNAYHFDVGGTIILADNLSNTGGTQIVAGVVMPMNTGGMVPPEGDGIETSPIAAEFGNSQSDFVCSVKWFQNDPIYGKGFMAVNKVVLHSPGDMEADSKIIIGKTNNGNGFAYWYLEAGVTLPYSIPCGSTGLGLRSFRGKLYSHMKQSGTIQNATYVPDASNTFGIYGEVGMEDVSDQGSLLWGKLSFEVMIGPGFTSVLRGHVNLLSSGFGQEDGMVKGDAVITVSTSPKLFDADFQVSVNIKETFCANGRLQFHVDENTWFLHVGTKEQPISTDLLCSLGGYSSYFTIDKHSTQIGVGFSFDTGYQTWGEGIGAYGRAWGGIGASASLNYSPFQFTGTATVEAHVVIGVFLDIKVYKGKLQLLSSNWSAGLVMTMPDPFCVAGKIHGDLCIDPCPIFSCDMCFGATLRVRYKNGSFALKDNCD